MAGIGFELKKLFRRKGLFASLRAYGYAGIICTGPMLLGVVLQLGILLLCGWVGAQRDQQDLLVCMITYTLLFSLTVTSFFSMPVTRYLADMLYEEQEQTILPSFWGSSSMMLVLGCTLYGLFLLVSGATLLQGLCRDDRELERHELPDRHQGLPGHPLFFSGCHCAGVRAGVRTGGAAGLSGAGRNALCCDHGLRSDDGLGCSAALPLLPAE